MTFFRRFDIYNNNNFLEDLCITKLLVNKIVFMQKNDIQSSVVSPICV